MNKNNRVEYAKLDLVLKSSKLHEETEKKGISNYKLNNVYCPVLDRKYIKNFIPEKTCISVEMVKDDFDEDKLIKQAIEQVKILKEYHLNNKYGEKEHIGQYSIFDNISVDDFYLNEYSIDKSGEDYYLILWFKPYKKEKRKHVYWYEKKLNQDFY